MNEQGPNIEHELSFLKLFGRPWDIPAKTRDILGVPKPGCFKPGPQGPYHTKNTTVIVMHYGRSINTTTVANHYGRVSETPCFPGENSQEISSNCELLMRT